MFRSLRYVPLMFVVVFCLISEVFTSEDDEESIEDVVRTLKGQVNALLERRQEDFRILEESIRHSLNSNSELAETRREVDSLRHELQELTGGPKSTSNQQKNDHLTIQWMSSAITEIRAELSELASSLNTSAELQHRQEMTAGLDLLRGDVASFRRDLEELRAEQQQTVVTLGQLKQDVDLSVRSSQQAITIFSQCKTEISLLKNESYFFNKELNRFNRELKQMKTFSTSEEADISDENSLKHNRIMLNTPKENKFRHHRVLRQQILDLEHANKNLQEEQNKLEKAIRKLEKQSKIQKLPFHLNTERIHSTDEMRFEKTTKKMSEQIFNLTRQMADLDRLHISMLQLLESVESLETKVDRTVPELQQEISKIEFNMAQLTSTVSVTKEEQDNERDTIKALSATLQQIEDRTELDHRDISRLQSQMMNITHNTKLLNDTERYQEHNTRLLALEQRVGESTQSTAQLSNQSMLSDLIQSLNKIEREYHQIVHHLPQDCSVIQGPNGIYAISPGEGSPLLVSCDMATSPGGWTVVQRRIDGSEEFNKKWQEYADGFGAPSGEYWLGNEALHRLTGDNCSSLRVEITDIYGKSWVANYEVFSIADKEDGYRLHVSGYHGNASDALEYQNNMQFSAMDSDRDISNTHCAGNYEGGWWFSHCQHANLNGKYNLGLTWFDGSRNEWIAVAFSEMKVRRRNSCSSSSVLT